MDLSFPNPVHHFYSAMPTSTASSANAMASQSLPSPAPRNKRLRKFGHVLRRYSMLEKLSHDNSRAASSPTLPLSLLSPASPRSPSLPQTTVDKCFCCGMVLTYPFGSQKFRCGRCNTTNVISPPVQSISKLPPAISHHYVKHLVDSCLASAKSSPHQSRSLHEIFEPLSAYTLIAFGSPECLSRSFLLRPDSSRPHYSSPNIDFAEVRLTFYLLTTLPTKRPLFNALSAAAECLRRPHIYSLGEEPRSLLWILVLLHIPFLSRLVSKTLSTGALTSMLDVPEITILCYDILKRCIGILVSVRTTRSSKYLARWFAKMPPADFQSHVELVNLYITFHLRRIVNTLPAHSPHGLALDGSVSLSSLPANPTTSTCQSAREYRAAMKPAHDESSLSHLHVAVQQKPLPIRIKFAQYTHDWHIKSGLAWLTMLYASNQMRLDPLSVAAFYNSMVDCVNITADFDEWQKSKLEPVPLASGESMQLHHVIAYIHGEQNPRLPMAFCFCQYPGLISLGAKISILEHEARRQMERSAEEAFINLLDRQIVIDVYLRIRVRRENIVQDSVRAIQENRDNLKKSLRVQFVNEPGIDAGGLKKEWFLLLTRTLFSPQTGMLYNVEDSNVLWFTIESIQGLEMYTLLGWVLGLALYNSNLLDLDFPLALYKLLLGEPLQFTDYQQIFPQSATGLAQLKDMDPATLAALDLTFEVSYRDLWGKAHTRELVPRGSTIAVDASNVRQYVSHYYKFFMYEGIRPHIDALIAGFKDVVGGNALSLFLGREIELLLCGSQEKELDLETLKSVTKYVGWRAGEDGSKLRLATWFWEYMHEASAEQRRKLLAFVTGSDRIPANGIQNLPLRITLVLNRGEKHLPVAHTCFNELALHNYSSKKVLVEKLTWAVNGASGFGIK